MPITFHEWPFLSLACESQVVARSGSPGSLQQGAENKGELFSNVLTDLGSVAMLHTRHLSAHMIRKIVRKGGE